MAKKITDRKMRSEILKVLAVQPCKWREGDYQPRMSLTDIAKVIDGASRARIGKELSSLEKTLKVISGQGHGTRIVWLIPNKEQVARAEGHRARRKLIRNTKDKLAKAIGEKKDRDFYTGSIRLSVAQVEKVLELLEK